MRTLKLTGYSSSSSSSPLRETLLSQVLRDLILVSGFHGTEIIRNSAALQNGTAVYWRFTHVDLRMLPQFQTNYFVEDDNLSRYFVISLESKYLCRYCVVSPWKSPLLFYAFFDADKWECTILTVSWNVFDILCSNKYS